MLSAQQERPHRECADVGLSIDLQALHNLLANCIPLLPHDLRRQARALDEVAVIMLRRRRLQADMAPMTWEHPRLGEHVIDGRHLHCRHLALSAAFHAVRDGQAQASDFAAPGARAAADVVRRALHRECLSWAVEHAPQLVPVLLACGVSRTGVVRFSPSPNARPVLALGLPVVGSVSAVLAGPTIRPSQTAAIDMLEPIETPPQNPAAIAARLRSALALRRPLLAELEARRAALVQQIAAGAGPEADAEFTEVTGKIQALTLAMDSLEAGLAQAESDLRAEADAAAAAATAEARKAIARRAAENVALAKRVDAAAAALVEALTRWHEAKEALGRDAVGVMAEARMFYSHHDQPRVLSACRVETATSCAIEVARDVMAAHGRELEKFVATPNYFDSGTPGYAHHARQAADVVQALLVDSWS